MKDAVTWLLLSIILLLFGSLAFAAFDALDLAKKDRRLMRQCLADHYKEYECIAILGRPR